MKKFIYCFSIIVLYSIITCSVSWGVCLQPSQYAIGGTLTVDGVQITASTDAGYVIKVTMEDGSDFINVDDIPIDNDGLNSSDSYTISIPIKSAVEATCNIGGANDGDTVIIHVYYNGTEYKVDSPIDGEITVAEGVSTVTEYLITAYSPKTLTINDNNINGTITPSPSAAEYQYDTEVTLTATPDSGYLFSSWTGDVEDSSSATTTIFMDEDQTVSASFVADTGSGGGSTSVSASDSGGGCFIKTADGGIKLKPSLLFTISISGFLILMIIGFIKYCKE